MSVAEQYLFLCIVEPVKLSGVKAVLNDVWMQNLKEKLTDFSHNKIKYLENSLPGEWLKHWGKRKGGRWGSTQDKKGKSLLSRCSVLFCHFNKLYTLKWCSGWFFTLFSWSCFMFCCIWKRFFYFKPLNIRLRQSDLRALIRAFHAYFITFKLSWNHWSVSVRFPLNLPPYKGMYRSLPKAVSFSKYLLTSATMATSTGWQCWRNRSLKYTGKFLMTW